MGALCAFPGPEARGAIKEIMHAYAECRIDRWKFDQEILQVLDVYGVTKLHVGDCLVKAIAIDTLFRTVLVTGVDRSDACPACGSGRYRYLTTTKEAEQAGYDAIVVFCMDCGAIYETLARNGERIKNV